MIPQICDMWMIFFERFVLSMIHGWHVLYGIMKHIVPMPSSFLIADATPLVGQM
jgi:hypothetical protein